MADKSYRKYGSFPYNIVVVHGGPGASGEMAPVAGQLQSIGGVLEPLQTANSINGQIGELKSTIEQNSDSPVILIGFSWGAWLSFILTAEYPELVSKLILISSGPFEDKYLSEFEKTRLDRLTVLERNELIAIFDELNNNTAADESNYLERLGELITKTDSFDHLPDNSYAVEFDPEIFKKVWPEAAKLRRSGELLAYAKKIKCPVVAIHGDYDPHPAEGVNKPLSKMLDEFKFILLEKCGHKPWEERYARDKFYEILKAEL